MSARGLLGLFAPTRRDAEPRGVRLGGATVLVTGATGGIGAAVARELRRRDALPVLSGRDPDRLARLAGELDARHVGADLVAGPDAAGALAQRAGPVDAVVHCAGTGRAGAFADCPPADIRRLLTLDLLAPMSLTRCLLPHMIRQGWGHVAFVGSIAGLTGVANEAVYSAAKAGLLTFADALRIELSGTGVGVSWIAPAAVDTGFWDERGAPYERSRPRPLPAQVVARLCVRDIEHGAARRITPRWLRAAPAVRGAAPGLYERLAQRFG